MEKPNCIPLVATLHFCIQCDKITAFDTNGHCFVCECDSPAGNPDDDTLSMEYWDENNRTTIIN